MCDGVAVRRRSGQMASRGSVRSRPATSGIQIDAISAQSVKTTSMMMIGMNEPVAADDPGGGDDGTGAGRDDRGDLPGHRP